MHMMKRLMLAVVIGAASGGAATLAIADEMQQPADEAVAAVQPVSTFPFANSVLSTEALDTQRGGDLNVTKVETDQLGEVNGNVAHHLVTGDNNITNSFAGTVGIPMVVQNSGNNVLIQNATTVNVQLY